MHELGIMSGVLDSAITAAKDAGSEKILKITLRVGIMTEAVEEAMQFAFEALSENTIAEGSTLEINMIEPESICLSCGNQFVHDRFHMTCPECESPFLELIHGKELEIASLEVDLPDQDEQDPSYKEK